MSVLSDRETSRRSAVHQPDPFASLNEAPKRRRRFWLFELFMGPFQDHDERATYHKAGKASEARAPAAIRVAKAWNRDGGPSGGNANEAVLPEGFPAMPATARGTRFSSDGRRPA